MEGKRIPLQAPADIVAARRAARELAEALGFDALGQVQVATALSELARNALEHAGGGEVILTPIETPRVGLDLVCRDTGPGIPDVQQALVGGFSTNRGLGRGLPGARALLNEFSVESVVDRGTVVHGRKWRS